MLNYCHTIIKCLITFVALNSAVTGQQTELKINYIANEGFLFESGKTKILVDAIFQLDSSSIYSSPDKKTLRNIISGLPPFDSIDYLLVTHNHRDHFDKELVKNFLLNNPKCKLICGSDIRKEIFDSTNVYDKIATQVITPTPSKNSFSDILKNENLRISALTTRHVPFRDYDPVEDAFLDKFRNLECLGYFINVNGRKIIHIGDALISMHEQVFKKMKNEKPDLLFLEYFDTSEKTEKVIKEIIKPDHLIFMHLDKIHLEDKTFFIELKQIFPNLIDIYEKGNSVLLK